MKKLLFIMMLGLLWSSCSDPSVEPDLPTIEVESTTASILSPKEASQIAEMAYAQYFGDSLYSFSRSVQTTVSAISANGARSANDTIAYIVNFGEDNGYSIVNSNRYSEQTLLAVVPNGHIDGLEDISVPAQRTYVETLLCSIQEECTTVRSRTDPWVITPMPEEKVERVPVGSNTYGKLSGLSWDQSGIFGKYCDNGLCGCFATAAAMVMATLEYPSSLYINFRNSKKTSVTRTIYPDWTDIKKHKGGTLATLEQPTSESLDNIGLICRQIGELAGTDYDSPNASSTMASSAKSALQTIFKGRSVNGYKSYDRDEVQKALETSKVIMSGWVNKDDIDNPGGHTWVAEVYSIQYYRTYYYTRPNSLWDWTLQSTKDTVEHTLFMNWGWNGVGNGYYSCLYGSSFTPSQGVRNTYKDIVYITIK